MKRLAIALAFVASPAAADLYHWHTDALTCAEFSKHPLVPTSCAPSTPEIVLEYYSLDEITLSLDGTHGFFRSISTPGERFFIKDGVELSLPWQLGVGTGTEHGTFNARLEVDALGDGLVGSFFWFTGSEEFQASGTATGWTGERSSDGPGWFLFTGNWVREPTTVPEPSTLMLLLVIGLVASLRRNQ